MADPDYRYRTDLIVVSQSQQAGAYRQNLIHAGEVIVC